MTALERVESEIGRLAQIAQRRALWDDEKQEIAIYRKVAEWVRGDAGVGCIPALPAQESASAAAVDEDKKVKDVFASYREKLKKEGRMR